MVILGVDPALEVTGLAFVKSSPDRFNILHLREIRTDSKRELPQRLGLIFKELNLLIERYKPSVLVLEKIYSHYRHPLTASILGQVRGIVVLLAHQKSLKFVEYPSTQVRKALTSRGSASKEQLKRMVSYLCKLNKPLASQHLVDALALVIAHIHIQKMRGIFG